MYQPLLNALRESSRIVFFGGAGVSTESGIPDYRSEDGVFRTLQSFGRPPEELLSRSFFLDHPDIFYAYYKSSLLHERAEPNGAHIALAKLEQAGKLAAVVTQNVDGLHQKAGSRRVYELHGSVFRNHCMDCGSTYTRDEILRPRRSRGPVPLCPDCGGIIRPDVVLYEEALDQAVMEGAAGAVEDADMLIVGGTSLAVYPAAGLVRGFGGEHFALINRDRTPYDHYATIIIHNAIGQVLSRAVAALGL